MNAGEDIDILAKNKRFVRRFGSAKTCRIDKCGHFMGPALARLLGALLHVSGSIDDLQVRDAPEGQQYGPRSVAIVVPDLEQGNVVIDLGILEQPFAGCETAALLKNLQVPDVIARRNP